MSKNEEKTTSISKASTLAERLQMDTSKSAAFSPA